MRKIIVLLYGILRIIIVPAMLVFAGSALNAQQYKVAQYGYSTGYQLDFVKSVSSDSLGFIWVGTDNGLYRFDGRKFTNYKADLPSILVKSLYRDKNDLYCVTDLGLVRIGTGKDTVIMETIIKGSRSRTDSLLWLPKSLYRDSRGNLWISEPDAVSLIKGNSFKRYSPGDKSLSYDFLKSFSFTEDPYGNLIAVSLPGYIYKYDSEKDEFTELKTTGPGKLNTVYSVEKLPSGKIVAGALNGIYELILRKDGSVKVIPLIKGIDATVIKYGGKNSFYAGTWNNGLIRIIGSESDYNYETASKFPKVNDLYIRDGNVWVSTDISVSLVRRNFIKKVLPSVLNNYVNDIIESPDGRIFISDAKQTGYIEEKNGTAEFVPVYIPGDEYILSSVFGRGYLWLSDSRRNIIRISPDGTKKFFTASELNYDPVLTSAVDANGNYWAARDISGGLIRITPDAEVKYYSAEKGIDGIITVIRENSRGEIICAGSYPDTKLYKYIEETDSFIVRSETYSEKLENIKVNDLFCTGSFVYIATSAGLFEAEDTVLRKSNLGIYSDESIRAVTVDEDNVLWAGAAPGLISRTGSTVLLFTDADGLPGSKISFRGLLTDSKNRKWIGTSLGTALVSDSVVSKVTPVPLITSFSVNGEERSLSEIETSGFSPGEFMQLDFLSLSFPGKSIVYKTELRGLNTGDSVISISTEPGFSYHTAEKGKFILKISARQQGAFTWSDPVILEFEVQPQWYMQWWAGILIITGVALLGYVFGVYYNRRLVKEKEKLEKLVKERTKELSQKNEEISSRKNELEELNLKLSEANATKDKFFSIISHDLKSPFTATIGFSELLKDDYYELSDEEKISMIRKIYNSASGSYKLLENLLDWSRVQMGRLELKKEELNLKETVGSVVEVLSSFAEKKNIDVVIDIPDDIIVYADLFTLRTVLRNITNNALKFTTSGGRVTIKSEKMNGQVRIDLTDTGRGMTEEEIGKLFRIDVNTSDIGEKENKGTGLGLILSKEFVEANNGTISAESSPGKGSTFSFTLQTTAEKTDK